MLLQVDVKNAVSLSIYLTCSREEDVEVFKQITMRKCLVFQDSRCDHMFTLSSQSKVKCQKYISNIFLSRLSGPRG